MVQPSASSISTSSIAGDSRMSSVSPLKARPRTPRRLPRRVHRAERTLVRKRFFWLDVDLFDLGEEAEVDAELLGDGAEGGDILGEAGAAVADAGAQETGADAAVQAHAARDLLDVGVGGLAEVGDGVDEGDLQREEGVRGVLDDLGALGGGEQQRRRLRDAAACRRWRSACL